jgi:hypothetical protein
MLGAIMSVISKNEIYSLIRAVESNLTIKGVETKTHQLSFPGDGPNYSSHMFVSKDTWRFARVDGDGLKVRKLDDDSSVAALQVIYHLGNSAAQVVKSGVVTDFAAATVTFMFCLNTLRANTGLFGGWGRDHRVMAKELSEKLEQKMRLF